MRILLTSPAFPPLANGVSHVVYQHAVGLLQRGHDITVATGYLPNRSEGDYPKGMTLAQFGVVGNAHCRTRYRGDLDGYKRFIAEFDGDVICCHCWQIWSTDLAVMAFPHTSARKVLVSHGGPANSRWRWPRSLPTWLLWRPYVHWDMPRILRSFDHLVFLSDRRDQERFYDRSLADKIGYRTYSIIPNGADIESHRSADGGFREKHGIDSEWLLVLCIGAYTPYKNERMVLEAFLASRVSRTALVFVAPRKNAYSLEMECLWERTKQRHPDCQVLFLDGLSRREILSAYRAADLFVSGSRSECLPLVILDAMASATAFISTDVGCVADLPGGRIVHSRSGMADMMAFLARNHEARQSLAQEGANACESRFAWSRVIDQYELLFADLCGSAPRLVPDQVVVA